MNWASLQTGLIDWADGLIAPVPVQWDSQPSALVYGAVCLLDITAIAQPGWDETHYAFNSVTNNLDTEHGGARTITLSLKIRSLDQSLPNSARAIGETFRTKCGAPSSIEALSQIGLGFAGVASFVLNDFDMNGRRVSQGNLDIKVNAVSSIAEIATDYIERIRGTGTLQPRNQTIGYTVP